MDKDKRRFSVRFHMDSERHARAWGILARQPEGMKGDFIIDAILGYGDVKQAVREAIHEVFDDVTIKPIAKDRGIANDEIPSEILDFLGSL